MSTSSSSNTASSSSTGFSATLSKALSAKSSWPDKENFLDSLYWLRQLIGVVLGLAFGLAGLKGAPALALFAGLSAGAGYFYCIGFQQVDEEDYGGVWELTKEGFMTSFAGFLVTWIIIYSGLHFD